VGTVFAFSLGILYANFVEWFVHKVLFHGLGKKKDSFFSFHLREHHKNVLKNNYYDSKFSKIEFPGIVLLLLTHLPLATISQPFYIALVIYGLLFVGIHNLLHKNPAFGHKYFRWHWNHHMSNQNKSWGVVLPLFDILAGTLEKRDEKY